MFSISSSEVNQEFVSPGLHIGLVPLRLLFFLLHSFGGTIAILTAEKKVKEGKKMSTDVRKSNSLSSYASDASSVNFPCFRTGRILSMMMLSWSDAMSNDTVRTAKSGWSSGMLALFTFLYSAKV